MKTLLLIRHSKAVKHTDSGKDFNRPLSEDGVQDVIDLAAKLKKTVKSIDFFISSPSMRTFETAKILADSFNYPSDGILTLKKLYRSETDILHDVIQSSDDSCKTVVLIGHNPELTELASSLTGNIDLIIPPSGCVAVRLPILKWTALKLNRNAPFELILPNKSAQSKQTVELEIKKTLNKTITLVKPEFQEKAAQLVSKMSHQLAKQFNSLNNDKS